MHLKRPYLLADYHIAQIILLWLDYAFEEVVFFFTDYPRV